MKTATPFVALALGAVMLGAGGAVAGPVNKNWIAADAKWYLHVDAEAGLNSTIGKFVVANRHKLGMGGLDDLRHMGIDPFTDIKGVTIYDTDDRDEHAVVVATTTAAVDQLLEALKSDPNTQSLTVDGHSMVAFNDNGKKQYWHVRNGPTPDSRVVFMSDDWNVVAGALKVADAQASSLAKAGPSSPLAGDPSPGSFIFVRAAELPKNVKKGQDANASAILGQISGVQIDVGERDGDVVAEAIVGATSADDAANMVQVGTGFLALGRMITKDNPDLAPISGALGAMSIAAKDRQITVSVKYKAQKVADALSALQKAEEKKKEAAEKQAEDKQ